ncbi:MAG: hypothetical protein HY293_01585 [Planctomycetes bacterium]|nr:hypothetical protein [Planctomycetota bacterium]
MKRAALVLTLGALAGCAAYLPLPDPMMAGGDEARLSDLRAGRQLYIDKCSGCHALKSVDRYDDATWTSEVHEMLAKKKVRLSDADRDQLLRYLTTANGR